MGVLQSILEYFPEEEILIADGFDDAVIGIETYSMRLIYSVTKCIEILEKEMPLDEAIEHFEYNVSGAYVGERTPIWCQDGF